MYDLTQLTLQNVTDIDVALRSFGKEADSLETVASRCVQYLHRGLVDLDSVLILSDESRLKLYKGNQTPPVLSGLELPISAVDIFSWLSLE